MDMQSLYDADNAKKFYDDRFQVGYMEEWDEEKKARVSAVLASLQLPYKGNALDYGCGNGVFTALIKKAYPSWNVYGCDISEVAISNARKRLPDCHFFLSEEMEDAAIKFDLVFSHHVLEHVYDIAKTMQDINNVLNEGASQLHICPCGNEGSLEHHISTHIRNGIDPVTGGRFFFEEKGHLRRLTTADMNSLMGKHQLVLEEAYYSNQYWGALRWMCNSGPKTFFRLANVFRSKNVAHAWQLIKKMTLPAGLYVLQFPSLLYHKSKGMKGKKASLIKALSYLPHQLTKPLHRFIRAKAEEEWRFQSKRSNGSEMYLLYRRV